MTAELVTAVEVGKSLYVYEGDQRKKYFVSIPKDMIDVLKDNAEKFRHVRISHDEWDTLLDWEDRVSSSSLEMVLLSAKYRNLKITEVDKKGLDD
jgi:hypothetical protein